MVSITTLGVAYTQDFNSLPTVGASPWTNDLTLLGWYYAQTGAGSGAVTADDGSSLAGNLYSYGSTLSADRALGSVGSNTAGDFFWGVEFTNNTGATITSLNIAYVGEQWRNGGGETAQTVSFSYLVANDVTGSLAEFQTAGTLVSALDFTSSVTGGTADSLDGNLAANRTAISYTITGLNIASGQEVMLRWSDPNHSGVDHGLAIDDLSVTAAGGSAAVPSLSIGDVSVSEGNSGTTEFKFTVSLSAPSDQTVTVAYTTADNSAASSTDYQTKSGTLTFAPGVTAQTVTILVNGDTVFEAAQSFFVNLSTPTNATIADGQAAGTIENDDAAPTLSIGDVSVSESGATATFTVTRTGATEIPVTVDYSTADDTAVSTVGGPGTPDFTSTSSTLTFAPSLAATATQSFTVSLSNDGVYESIEQLLVNLSDATGATISDGQAVGTITNDDAAPRLSIDDVTVSESAGTVTFTVTLTGATALPISVDYKTADATAVSIAGATPGTPDYTATTDTLTFGASAAGSQTLSFTVPLSNDGVQEPTEQFAVNLSNATNGSTITDGQGIATINDDDALPTISIEGGEVEEGNSGTKAITFTVSLSAPSIQTVTVAYHTENDSAVAGPDYMATSGTLEFAPGETTKQITVTVNGDTVFELDQDFVVVLTNPTNAQIEVPDETNIGFGTILNDDARPTISIDSVEVSEASGSATLTLTRHGESEYDVSVGYATADGTAVSAAGGAGTPDYVSQTGKVNFDSSDTQTISILLADDFDTELAEAFSVNLIADETAAIASGQGTGTVTIIDDDPGLVVTTLADVIDDKDGKTSLREALAFANFKPGADTITFASDLKGGVIRLASERVLFATETVTIDGDIDNDGKADITISGDRNNDDIDVAGGNELTNIFASQTQNKLADNVQILNGFDLTLDGLILTGGYTSEGAGGGVSATRLSLINSVVSGNAATQGGGVWIGQPFFLPALVAEEAPAVSSTISGSTIENNSATQNGGGVGTGSVFPSGDAFAAAALGTQDLTITNSTLSGNVAGGQGGGVLQNGFLALTNVTLSGNNSGTVGGGAFSTTAALTNVTVSGNKATIAAGGVAATSVGLTNSILMGNAAPADSDVTLTGSPTLSGTNIIGNTVYGGSSPTGTTTAVQVFAATTDIGGGVLAGVLANNGGSVKTIALALSDANPALDASNSAAPERDARGFARVDQTVTPNVNGTAADIGAFELQTDFAPPINTAPVNGLAAFFDVEANVATVLSGLNVTDVDAGSGNLTTTLSVTHGTLTASSAGASVAGSGTASVTLTGTLAQINATLAGVTYKGELDYFGPETLTMVTNDQGNTGVGGARTDTDTAPIKLHTHLVGTSGNNDYTALPGNEWIEGHGGVDTVKFNFNLVDAKVTYRDNFIIIDGPTGSHTLLNHMERFIFNDGTVENNDGNPLVDDLFYYSRNHDVWKAHVDADAHYNSIGWHENRDPNAFFSTKFYLATNPDVKNANINPLEHWHNFGWHEDRMASPLFDGQQYLDANPDVKAAGFDPLWHYLQYGYDEGRVPYDLIARNGFDYAYYLDHNPDVAAAGVDPFAHFETIGWKEGRNPNEYFDTNGYLAAYTDVKNSGANPLDHYHEFGWKEGRDPSAAFDTTLYLDAYPDVAAKNTDPLWHFISFGRDEYRTPFTDGHFG